MAGMLGAAAAQALAYMERVRGVFEQWRDGVWDARLSGEQSADLADRVSVMSERVRYTREWAGQPLEVPAEPAMVPGQRLRLPLNRKERFYTGTVLPMVVASDGFAYLGRFLRLCGLDVTVGADLEGNQDVQFFTEYGFAESVFTAADREAWPDPVDGDTPDVVIAGPDWLLAVEAKMFHNPSAADLTGQMRRQRAVVDVWAARLGLAPERVRHVLLLPERLEHRVAGDLVGDVVTWELVLGAFWTVAPRYWANVLHRALARHEELESSRELRFRANAQALMSGAEIVEAHAMGSLAFDHVGRGGGLYGARFAEDVASGRWRSVKFEVRVGELHGNPNWFPLSDFLAATAGKEGAGVVTGEGELVRLLARVAADEVPFEELVDFFRGYEFPARERDETEAEAEARRWGVGDPDPFVPGSWDDVSQAYVSGRISDEQYRVLVEAVTEAGTFGRRDQA